MLLPTKKSRALGLWHTTQVSVQVSGTRQICYQNAWQISKVSVTRRFWYQ